RYLPEYRALREKAAGFLDLCFDAKRAAEITLQPIRRFGFDAAILFSDILVVPHALGQCVSFVEGEGPRLDALNAQPALQTLGPASDHGALDPVYETITRVRQDLPPAVALLGFCGAPWTLATYMIAGQGTPDQSPARLFAYRHPEAFAKLIEALVDASAGYLVRQFAAGIDAVQIFDTWAGILPAGEFEMWCIRPLLIVVAVSSSAPALLLMRSSINRDLPPRDTRSLMSLKSIGGAVPYGEEHATALYLQKMQLSWAGLHSALSRCPRRRSRFTRHRGGGFGIHDRTAVLLACHGFTALAYDWCGSKTCRGPTQQGCRHPHRRSSEGAAVAAAARECPQQTGSDSRRLSWCRAGYDHSNS